MKVWVTLGVACLALTAQAAESRAGAPRNDEEGIEILPSRELFEPLVADIRWPRFTAAHEWRLGSDEFDRAGVVGFGETFAFVQGPAAGGRLRWEAGFLASVTSLFDLTAPSEDLSNADYLVGLSASLRVAKWTVLARLYHVSSHAGDEYLIRTNSGRRGISFETLDVLVSRPLGRGFRAYGGANVIINTSSGLDPVGLQVGSEWVMPTAWWKGRIRPIAGVDFQVRQDADFKPEVSVLAGFRFAQADDDVRRIELFGRYYHGRAPEGQFFDQTIDSLGLGLRLGF